MFARNENFSPQARTEVLTTTEFIMSDLADIIIKPQLREGMGSREWCSSIT